MTRGAAPVAGLLVAALCGSPAATGQTRQVTGATGRVVDVPAVVAHVYPAGPPANVVLLALAPDKLAGLTRAPRPDERAYLPEVISSLPEVGRLTGRGNAANVEAVMQTKPDVIVDVGSTSASYVTLAASVQERTKIPYLLFDGALADTPRLLRDVGRAIGAGGAAETLARDAQATLLRVAGRVEQIPESERPRVYLARGPNGLTTAPRGSFEAETLSLAGGYNVVAPPPGFTGNVVDVSMEDVLRAKPAVIIASDRTFAATVRTLPQWRDVPAVRDGRVYVPPGTPFGWFDSPPSINRLLGVEWLVRVLHPQAFPEPLGPRISAFHSLYYHREPTAAQVRALLDLAGVAK